MGQSVVLTGLTSRPDLLDALCTVMSFDVAAARVAVKVSASGECIKVKPYNLEVSVFGGGGHHPLREGQG